MEITTEELRENTSTYTCVYNTSTAGWKHETVKQKRRENNATCTYILSRTRTRVQGNIFETS